MKWPEYIVLVRHLASIYNTLKARKLADPLYREFLEAFNEDWEGPKAKYLAERIGFKFSLRMSDADTPLEKSLAEQGKIVGQELKKLINIPDVIFVSPYLRTRETLTRMIGGWPELSQVETIYDERIREQSHGLVTIYNDWKLFAVLHPDQKILRDQEGPYWYQFPQGESTPEVRDRNRLWIQMVIREFAGKKVLVITHHLNILAILANLLRWDTREFIRRDEEEKPVNGGVTILRGNPDLGKDGRMILRPEEYNMKLY